MTTNTRHTWIGRIATALLFGLLYWGCGDDEGGLGETGEVMVSNSTSNGTSGAGTSNATSGGTTGGTTGGAPTFAEVVLTASADTAEVGGAPVTITVAGRLSDGAPAEARTPVTVLEQGYADSGLEGALGFFGQPPASDANRGRVEAVLGGGGETTVSFSCEATGNARLIAQSADGATLMGSVDVVCAPPQQEWEVASLEQTGGELLITAEAIEVTARAILPDGTPVPEGTGLELSIEAGDTLALPEDAAAQTDAEGMATWTVTPTGAPGATTLRADFQPPAAGAGATLELVLMAPMAAPPIIEVTVRRGDEALNVEDLELRADDVDEALVEVTVTAPEGAEYDIEGLALTFSKLDNLGYLRESPEDETDRFVVERTLGAEGTASALFGAGGTGGDSVLEIALEDPRPGAERPIRQELAIHITALQAVEVFRVSDFTMPIRYDDDPAQITVVFQAKDNRMRAMPGIPITLEATAERAGVGIEPLGGVTDEEGKFETTITSGFEQASVAVIATGELGDVSVNVTSPPFPMLADLPSRREMALTCDVVNVGGLMAPLDGDAAIWDEGVMCQALVRDRHGNPLGIPNAVRFMSEAGTLVGPIETFPWDTNIHSVRPPVQTGNAFTTFLPGEDATAPCDVAPVEGEFAREVEGVCAAVAGCPARETETCVQNPRDGLITVVAIVDGEESFTDENGNGQWDEGEPFWDQGEPYVDVNDNNQWDEGEPFEDADGDQTWTPPNGAWDAVAPVWHAARVMWSGDPEADVTFVDTAAPDTPVTDGHAPTGAIAALWRDASGNPLPANAVYTARFVGPSDGLALTVMGRRAEDGFGFMSTEVSDATTYMTQLTGWSDQPGHRVSAMVTISNPDDHAQTATLEFEARYWIVGAEMGPERVETRQLVIDLGE